MNKISCWLLFTALITTQSLLFTSCSDSDSSSGGVPEITGVRSCDPAKADSLFTKASCGQIIAVIGNNLGSALKVYINDQEAYFNPTMNTDHSIVVNVPTEKNGFKLTAFDSSLKDEIRVETTHGSCTYSFKITAGYPSISRIAADYPRETGDEINLYGINLTDIEKAYFTDLTAAHLDTTKWTEIGGTHVDIPNLETVVKNRVLNAMTNSYETISQLKFTMPEVPYSEGSIVLECAGGKAYVPYFKTPGVPELFSVSTDMPQIGETLILTGREFVQVNSVKYGDVTLTENEFSVSESQDTIYVAFQKKPSQGSGTTLTVTTPGGSVSTDGFYDYTTILTTFDGDATDNGWGPNASYENSGTADGVFAHINVPEEAQQWWGVMVYFRKDWSGNSFPLSDNIPATATADEVYFAVNVYSESDYNNGAFWGYIRYMFQPIGDAENQYDNDFEWEDYDAQVGKFGRTVLGDINGLAPTGKWYRHVLPLSCFACYKGKNYAEIQATGLNQFRLQSINQSTTRGKVDVKFDNARVIYIPKK